LKALIYMKYLRSKADPCLYFKWIKGKLQVWITWVDDCLILGQRQWVLVSKEQMKKLFDCDDIGEMQEYVGCKVERNWQEGWIRLTQPVMLQTFIDEFDLDEHGKNPRTPAEPGSVLKPPLQKTTLDNEHQKLFRSGTGKLLHMMRWTRPEILNSVRELSRAMLGATMSHLQAMQRVMKYCVSTSKRGLLLKPTGVWDGGAEFEFTINGKSDSEYAKDETRKSVNGWAVWLNDAPISFRSKMMPIVALSVTEAELFAAVLCAQDMLFAMRILNSMGLKVKLPMKLEIDNKGAKDFTHNHSVGGRTRHVEVKQYFLRELKEAGLVICEWCGGEDMSSDIFTKNCPGKLFDKHIQKFVGYDEYMMANGVLEHGTHKGRVLQSSCESHVGLQLESQDEVDGQQTDGKIRRMQKKKK
jgi:hypothetical protein